MTLNSLHNPAYRVQISGQQPSPAAAEQVMPAPTATPVKGHTPVGPDRVHISAEARMLAAGEQPETVRSQMQEPSRQTAAVSETTEPRRIHITA